MNTHLSYLHHHAHRLHAHVHHHAKRIHEHIKRHGKWYIYSHLFIASALFSLVSHYQNQSNAALDANLCIQPSSGTSIVLEYSYTSPKNDIILKGISFDRMLFPDVVVIKKVKQLSPVPNNGELSTDRGDLASYTVINKENPNEQEIAGYLSNNNLNNLIDGEGGGEVNLDVEFEQTLSDNSPIDDSIGELLIFERGMNSDITIQAVNKLGGEPIGNKYFLDRKNITDAGFSIDTTEIDGSQKVGYWKVDLNKLGVATLSSLRITSTSANAGPDFKILGLNSKKCEIKPLAPLTVESLCSSSPETSRSWKVTNPNKESIPFSWDIYRSQQTGIQMLSGYGETNIQARPVDGATIFRVFVNDELQTITPNTGTTCPVIQPAIPLSLTPLCSSDPDSFSVWKVRNDNNSDVSFSWNITPSPSCKGNKVLVCQVPGGNPSNEHEICIAQAAVPAHLAQGGYTGACLHSQQQATFISRNTSLTFTTPVLDEAQELVVSIDNKEHDRKHSISTRCPKGPVNDYTLSISTDKKEVVPHQTLNYTIHYNNNGPEPMESGYLDITMAPEFIYIPEGDVEELADHQYRFSLPLLAAHSSSTLEISGIIITNTISDDFISLKAFISTGNDSVPTNNTTTFTLPIQALQPLELSSLCSDDPSQTRAWRVFNPNPTDVPVELYIQNQLSTGFSAKANKFTYVTTPTIAGTNLASLWYNGQNQLERSSEYVVCPKPISDLTIDHVKITNLKNGIFTADITVKNLGPNNSQDIVIDIAGEAASFVTQTGDHSQVETTLSNIDNQETYTLSVTGSLISGDAQLAVSVNGNTIDPNIANNNLQTTISSTSVSSSQENEKRPDTVHFSADDTAPSSIQGHEIGEQVESTGEYTEDVIGLGCSYTDEAYEKIKFQDIVHHWSKPFVELLRINCIIKGREVNKFITEAYIKRAEAIKVAIKLRGMKNNRKVKSDKYMYLGDTPMSDVNNAHRSAQYVDKAYQIGLLDSLSQGTTTKRLLPEKNITRGESVELLVKTYFLLENTSLDVLKNVPSSIFTDIPQDASYLPYVNYAYTSGFLEGIQNDDGTSSFFPDQAISRSEFVKLAALIFNDSLPVFRIK